MLLDEGRKGNLLYLDAVVVGRLQVHLRCDDASLVLRHLKHLDVVVLATGDHVVIILSVGGSRVQAHHCRLVTPGQLPDRVELPQVPQSHLLIGLL